MEDSSPLSVAEGRIEALRIAPGKVNLIEDIQQGALFTGIAAGLSGQAGVLANSASLALYDGEDVEHIACLINGQLAVGTFEWLKDLNVDDEVKLVVSKIEDGPLFVHGILRKSDQLLWLPYSVDHTRRGWVMHAIKLSSALLAFTYAVIFLFNWLAPLSRSDGLYWFGLGGLAVIAFAGIMSTTGVMALGQQAEDIFQALGIPKFQRFRIKPYSLMMDFSVLGVEDRQRKGHIFKFADALAAHKKKCGLA